MLNRANARMQIFEKEADYAAVESGAVRSVSWVREVAQRTGLGYTLRSRGRPRKHHPIT